MGFSSPRILALISSSMGAATEAANSDLKRLASFDFSQENKYNAVSDYYAVINNCNYFLNHVDTTLERRGHKIFKAEYAVVKAYRAWAYLQVLYRNTVEVSGAKYSVGALTATKR